MIHYAPEGLWDFNIIGLSKSDSGYLNLRVSDIYIDENLNLIKIIGIDRIDMKIDNILSILHLCPYEYSIKITEYDSYRNPVKITEYDKLVFSKSVTRLVNDKLIINKASDDLDLTKFDNVDKLSDVEIYFEYHE